MAQTRKCISCGGTGQHTKRGKVGGETGWFCEDCAYFSDGNLIEPVKVTARRYDTTEGRPGYVYPIDTEWADGVRTSEHPATEHELAK